MRFFFLRYTFQMITLILLDKFVIYIIRVMVNIGTQRSKQGIFIDSDNFIISSLVAKHGFYYHHWKCRFIVKAFIVSYYQHCPSVVRDGKNVLWRLRTARYLFIHGWKRFVRAYRLTLGRALLLHIGREKSTAQSTPPSSPKHACIDNFQSARTHARRLTYCANGKMKKKRSRERERVRR